MLKFVFLAMILAIGSSFIIDLLFHKKYTFITLILCLFISQLLIVKPNVYINWGGDERYYRVFGMSLSSIISMIFIVYLSFYIFIDYLQRKWEIPLMHIIILGIPLIILLVALGIGSVGKVKQITEFLKIYFPLVLLVYCKCTRILEKIPFKKLLISINCILIGQTWICKLLTGKFCQTIFYPELSREFYGYYNSPHPMSACLCILSIFLIYFYFQKKKVGLVILFLINQAYIVLLNVTSYMALEILAIFVIFALSILKTGNRKANQFVRKYSWLTILFIPVILYVLFQTRLYDNYSAGNLTNGRTSRLGIDMKYYINQMNLVHQLFGNGFYSIYTFNKTLITTEINSLNYIVDMLFDIGLVGMITFTSTVFYLFNKVKPKTNNTFFYAIVIFVIGGMIINNIFPYITVMLLVIIGLEYLYLQGEKSV